ncbi:MAG: hypothetical protein AAGU19_12515 [Prolixibacteraceae bacterium]
MASFDKEKFQELASERSNYCTSIYISTQRVGENRESILALKNQLSRISNQLLELGMSTGETERYLEPMRELTGSTGMWRFLSDSLCIFRSPDKFFYTTLPFEVDELGLVSNRFHLLPLLSVFNNNHRFLILRLSLNGNSLYKATTEDISEILVGDFFPENMQDSVGVDNEKSSLQFRGGQTGDGLGLYAGIGPGKDLKEREIRKYLQDIDNGLTKVLDDFSLPLVVVSVEHLFSVFKSTTSYKNVYPHCIAGNYDHVKDHVLHEKALELLKPYFEQVKNEGKEKFRDSPGKVTSNVNEVIRAAYEGKVDTLFIGKGAHVWGNFDPGTGVLRRHEDKKLLDNCLLDLAAQATFLKGGKVFVEKPEYLPENITPVNAILRY